jgi:hypothetical protein
MRFLCLHGLGTSSRVRKRSPNFAIRQVNVNDWLTYYQIFEAQTGKKFIICIPAIVRREVLTGNVAISP